MLLDEAIEEFFLARMPKKHSPHTLAAYRRDLDTIAAELAAVLGQLLVMNSEYDLEVDPDRLCHRGWVQATSRVREVRRDASS